MTDFKQNGSLKHLEVVPDLHKRLKQKALIDDIPLKKLTHDLLIKGLEE